MWAGAARACSKSSVERGGGGGLMRVNLVVCSRLDGGNVHEHTIVNLLLLYLKGGPKLHEGIHYLVS